MVVGAVERVSRFLLKLDQETNWHFPSVSLDERLYSTASMEDVPLRRAWGVALTCQLSDCGFKCHQFMETR